MCVLPTLATKGMQFEKHPLQPESHRDMIRIPGDCVSATILLFPNRARDQPEVHVLDQRIQIIEEACTKSLVTGEAEGRKAAADLAFMQDGLIMAEVLELESEHGWHRLRDVGLHLKDAEGEHEHRVGGIDAFQAMVSAFVDEHDVIREAGHR